MAITRSDSFSVVLQTTSSTLVHTTQQQGRQLVGERCARHARPNDNQIPYLHQRAAQMRVQTRNARASA